MDIPNIDRPDIVKQSFKQTLSFKEVKDCLFKFLMRAGVEFSDAEKLFITTEMHSKYTDESATLNNSFYTATCKIHGVTVNGKPVYLLVLPCTYSALEFRQRNKILSLKKVHNIILFDESDWTDVGIELSDKKWLKPLNKQTLKALAKKLLEKVGGLEGTIDTEFTLNDLYHNIDMSTSTQIDTTTIDKFRCEISNLKNQLRVYKMKDFLDVKDSHDAILTELSTLDSMSTKWVESTIDLILSEILYQIDLRQNIYKDLFRLKNGKIVVSHKDKLCEFITSELSKRRPNLSVSYLGYGLIEIQNTKTLQIITLYIQSTQSDKINPIEFTSDIIKKINTRLIFTLTLKFSKSTSKVHQTFGDIILTSYCADLFKYDRDHRLPVYDSKVNKTYSLWFID